MARLHHLWTWLPAFRAVAETEHLPTAGERLHVSASALSRAVKLLEQDLARPLFRRAGRRLVLRSEGKILLEALRTSMRQLDGAIDLLSGETLAGPVTIAAPSAFVPLFVLPVVSWLRTRHPALVPRIITASASEARRRLLDGSLDVALLDDPEPDGDLVIRHWVSISYGVYCGPGHPLFSRRRVTLAQILEHPFVAPPDGVGDHWAPHLPRRIGLEMTQLELGVRACAGGGYLAVLPSVVVESLPTRLRRLPVKLPSETALHIVHRRDVGVQGGAEAVVQALLSRRK